MSLTLTAARARVRFLVDDVDAVLVTDADIDDALKTAMFEAYNLAVTAGSNIFQVEGQVTTSSAGVGSLASLAPLKVNSVAVVRGQLRIPTPALRAKDAIMAYTVVETLLVSYVPRVTFPASGAASFVWGSASIDLPQLDKLTVAIAASELKITENEVLVGLETRKAELKTAVESLCNVPGWTVMPMSPNRQMMLRYYMSGVDQLQLVYG